MNAEDFTNPFLKEVKLQGQLQNSSLGQVDCESVEWREPGEFEVLVSTLQFP